jgi:ABC-type sulfate/molybdate transport systems ATPase subunit
MSYAICCYGATSKMKQFERKVQRMLQIVGFGAAAAQHNKDRRGAQRLLVACAHFIQVIIGCLFVDIPRPVRAARVSRTIDSFSDADCYDFLTFAGY